MIGNWYLGPPNPLKSDGPTVNAGFMLEPFFVKNAVCYDVVLDMVFFVSWIPSWATFGSELGLKSLPTWGPRATFCLYLRTSIFNTPPMKIFRFYSVISSSLLFFDYDESVSVESPVDGK